MAGRQTARGDIDFRGTHVQFHILTNRDSSCIDAFYYVLDDWACIFLMVFVVLYVYFAILT
jgi:hypothetical protein